MEQLNSLTVQYSHWLIVAHQYVEKIDEDTYSTKLVGHKYKLAHK